MMVDLVSPGLCPFRITYNDSIFAPKLPFILLDKLYTNHVEDEMSTLMCLSKEHLKRILIAQTEKLRMYRADFQAFI